MGCGMLLLVSICLLKLFYVNVFVSKWLCTKKPIPVSWLGWWNINLTLAFICRMGCGMLLLVPLCLLKLFYIYVFVFKWLCTKKPIPVSWLGWWNINLTFAFICRMGCGMLLLVLLCLKNYFMWMCSFSNGCLRKNPSQSVGWAGGIYMYFTHLYVEWVLECCFVFLYVY